MADRFHDANGVAGADLVQAARVGLVAAVDRYDPGRPNPFIAHAIACINGELRRCLRDSAWRVHMSRTLKELALQVAKARDALTATLGRSSTLTGDYLGVASWLLPDAHLPAAAPGPAPDARPAGLSADRGGAGGRGNRRAPAAGGLSSGAVASLAARPAARIPMAGSRAPGPSRATAGALAGLPAAASPRGWRCPAGVATAWSRPG
ncbi:MAG: sigma factor [Actinomycetes bacterium]